MNERNDSKSQRCPSRIEQESIAWFTRINGEPSAADRRDFEAWRKRDPRHEQAYLDVAGSWRSADTASAKAAIDEADKLKSYLDAIASARKRRRKMNGRIAAAGVLLICVLGANTWLQNPNLLQNMSADFVTARAERREVLLSDGSSVLLDADSALSEDMDGTTRRVTLLRGAGYFDVKKSAVPFIINAGPGSVRVLGTAFSVEILEDEVAVALARGSVAVTSSSGPERRTETLTPGEGITYDDTGLREKMQVPLEDELSWRDGRFIFDNARLGDVVKKISRYRSGKITIVGSALANQRVSGNLPLDDPDAALESLQATVGFRLFKVGGQLVVLTPRTINSLL